MVALLLPCVSFRDLKRDIATKVGKLERRTQRAMAEMLRKSFSVTFLRCGGATHVALVSPCLSGDRILAEDPDNLAAKVDAAGYESD